MQNGWAHPLIWYSPCSTAQSQYRPTLEYERPLGYGKMKPHFNIFTDNSISLETYEEINKAVLIVFQCMLTCDNQTIINTTGTSCNIWSRLFSSIMFVTYWV